MGYYDDGEEHVGVTDDALDGKESSWIEYKFGAVLFYRMT